MLERLLINSTHNVANFYYRAILRDLLISVPSMYILTNNFSIVYINQWNIENRQYLVNTEAIGAVFMTESANTFPLPGSW